MDFFCLVKPVLSKIFLYLPDKIIYELRSVCRAMKVAVDSDKYYWMRKISDYFKVEYKNTALTPFQTYRDLQKKYEGIAYFTLPIQDKIAMKIAKFSKSEKFNYKCLDAFGDYLVSENMDLMDIETSKIIRLKGFDFRRSTTYIAEEKIFIMTENKFHILSGGIINISSKEFNHYVETPYKFKASSDGDLIAIVLCGEKLTVFNSGTYTLYCNVKDVAVLGTSIYVIDGNSLYVSTFPERHEFNMVLKYCENITKRENCIVASTYSEYFIFGKYSRTIPRIGNCFNIIQHYFYDIHQTTIVHDLETGEETEKDFTADIIIERKFKPPLFIRKKITYDCSKPIIYEFPRNVKLRGLYKKILETFSISLQDLNPEYVIKYFAQLRESIFACHAIEYIKQYIEEFAIIQIKIPNKDYLVFKEYVSLWNKSLFLSKCSTYYTLITLLRYIEEDKKINIYRFPIPHLYKFLQIYGEKFSKEFSAELYLPEINSLEDLIQFETRYHKLLSHPIFKYQGNFAILQECHDLVLSTIESWEKILKQFDFLYEEEFMRIRGAADLDNEMEIIHCIEKLKFNPLNTTRETTEAKKYFRRELQKIIVKLQNILLARAEKYSEKVADDIAKFSEKCATANSAEIAQLRSAVIDHKINNWLIAGKIQLSDIYGPLVSRINFRYAELDKAERNEKTKKIIHAIEQNKEFSLVHEMLLDLEKGCHEYPLRDIVYQYGEKLAKIQIEEINKIKNYSDWQQCLVEMWENLLVNKFPNMFEISPELFRLGVAIHLEKMLENFLKKIKKLKSASEHRFQQISREFDELKKINHVFCPHTKFELIAEINLKIKEISIIWDDF